MTPKLSSYGGSAASSTQSPCLGMSPSRIGFTGSASGGGLPQERADQAFGGAACGEQDADRRVASSDLREVDGRDCAVDGLRIAVENAVLDERRVEVREQPVEHHGVEEA